MVTQATVFTWNGPGDDRNHSFQVGDSTVSVRLGNSSHIYDYNLASLTASPNAGYRFVRWEVQTKAEDTEYEVSEPKVQYLNDFTSENPAFYLTNAAFYLTDFSQETYLFDDGIVYHIYKHWTVNVVAVFEATYTVTAAASPSNGGIVQVGSEAPGSTSTLANITAGKRILVQASAAAGYVFERWSDGSGSLKHDIIVNSNISLTAYFTRLPTHLLVNSSTVERPAHLVYDPSTNLLVADY